ncbi:hypothetical protein [Candidatus Nitrosocosmicus sp. R]
MFHKIYQRTGPQNEVANPQYASSTAKCDPCDTMVSGGGQYEILSNLGAFVYLTSLSNKGDTEENSWTIQARSTTGIVTSVQAIVYCFDNP